MEGKPSLRTVAQNTCGKLFEYYSEFLILGTYHRGDSASVPVAFLTQPLPTSNWVGDHVEPNDEQVFIDAADLASLTALQPMDYLVENATGIRRNIITAHLDMTGTLWTFIARKVF